MRFTVLTILVLLCASMSAQNPAAMISKSEIAQKNGDYGIALDGYKEAARIAAIEKDTLSELAALERIVSIGISEGKPELSLDARIRKVTLLENRPGYHAFDKLYDYGDIPVYLAKLGKRDDAYLILRVMRKALKECGNNLFAYGFYSMQEGMTFQNLDEWDKAAVSFSNSEKFFRQCPIDGIDDYLKMVMPLSAGALYQAGRLEESLDKYTESAKYIKSLMGKRNMDYAKALCRQANIEAYNGDIASGSGHYAEALDIAISLAAQDLQLLPANAREKYWQDINNLMWDITPYALEAGLCEDEFTSKAYEAVMFSKGLMLSIEKSTRQMIESSGNQKLLDDYLIVANQRNRIEELKKEKKGAEITDVYAGLDSLERKLTQSMLQNDISPSVYKMSANDILSSLKKGDAIIDFYDFRKKSGDHFYVAFILKPGMRNPKLVKVFEQAELISLLEDSGNKCSNLLKEYNCETLTEILWKPLAKELKDTKRIFFVPSGILHQFPMESLPVTDDKTIADIYDFIRLTSSAEIPMFDNREKSMEFASARLYGGLCYDVDGEEMLAEARSSQIDPLLAMRGGTDGIKASEGFEPLKMSGDEVIEIASILAQNNIKADTLMKTKGTEESFFGMDGNSPDLLLLSTHGFYYSPENVPSWSSLNGYDNPMYLTGLVMSGGNAEYMKREIPDGVMGGLLTSADISGLDLSNTRMVVLSACETGLGETTNEGVYGLQRAFKKAGAGTLVMSLWPVSDKATKEFMVSFHNELVGKGWNKREAFSSARQALKQKYPDPYYWAAFIMVD